MAFLKSDFEFTGSIGGLSAYNLPGVDGTVLRTKGGGDKKKILTAASCKLTRQNAAEYGACGKMGGSIRRSMLPMVPLADHNFVSNLNALAKIIQLLDTEGHRGERSIALSGRKEYLRGFSLNKNTAFESIVRHPLEYQIDRGAGKAVVLLPELMQGVNLMTSRQYPVFRFLVNLGCVADRTFGLKGYLNEEDMESCCFYTGWHHTQALFEAREVLVELKDPSAIGDTTTLILSVGIQMGTPVSDLVVNPAKHGGCAKIIGVG